jgi:hypothetical protein
MTKVDIQLFQTSLRVVTSELEPFHNELPKKVYDELSAMETVIERELKNERTSV